MRTIGLSLIAVIGLGVYAQAGGDIAPVTFYETEDEVLASEAKASEALVEEAMVEEEESTMVEPMVMAPLVAKPATVESDPMPTPPPVVVIEKVTPAPKMKKEAVKKAPPLLSKASPQRGLYAGVGISSVWYDTNCACTDTRVSGTDQTSGVIAKLGYTVNDYLALETRGIVTFLQDDGGTVNHVGVFVKPSYPIDDFNLYGLVGWGQSKTSGSLRETDVNGLAWGGGVAYDLSEQWDLFVDYERLFEKSNAPDLESFNMGITYHF